MIRLQNGLPSGHKTLEGKVRCPACLGPVTPWITGPRLRDDLGSAKEGGRGFRSDPCRLAGLVTTVPIPAAVGSWCGASLIHSIWPWKRIFWDSLTPPDPAKGLHYL